MKVGRHTRQTPEWGGKEREEDRVPAQAQVSTSPPLSLCSLLPLSTRLYQRRGSRVLGPAPLQVSKVREKLTGHADPRSV